jgi:predicted RecA/RadA family phage recombinase
MKNFIQPGEMMEITAGAEIKSGDPVVVGEMVTIAAHDIANGANGQVSTCGVFEVVKLAGATWSKGQKLFWDKVAKKFTTIASADADLVAGIAFEDALLAATVGYIKLCGPAVPKVMANIADIATADANDPATTQALTNENKAKINAILAGLRASGAMDNA